MQLSLEELKDVLPNPIEIVNKLDSYVIGQTIESYIDKVIQVLDKRAATPSKIPRVCIDF